MGSELASFLDRVVEDDDVLSSFRAVLEKDEFTVALDDDDVRTLERDCELTIVAKFGLSYRHDVGMGDHYRVIVAIGGVQSVRFGVVEAEICFATLWLSLDGSLITIDYSAVMGG